MAISFGGLSTGLDTSALIKSLMEIERQPVTRLQRDKTYYDARFKAYSDFNAKLASLLSSVRDMDSGVELRPQKTTLSKEGFFGATASSAASSGTYELKAYSLAKVEKLISNAGQFADKSTTTYKTGVLQLTVGGSVTNITINDTNNTLSGIMSAINNSDAAVTATIINDGDAANPYRLVLTADAVATTIPDYDGADNEAGNEDDERSISLDVSGLTNGSGSSFAPTFTVAQQASKSHISVDNTDIYGTTNSFSEAIHGMTITLDDADEGATTTVLSVRLDEAGITAKIQKFVTAYNDMLSFIASQSKTDEHAAGILNGDTTLANIKRRVQGLLTTKVGGSGSIQSFSELGIATQKDGTLKLDSGKLSDIIKNNSADLVKLLAGEHTDNSNLTGIASQFTNYLAELTNSADGFLAGRKKTANSLISRIDKDIASLELRVSKREETLTKQFSALEQLVSSMNSQSDYLAKQMNVLNNLWSYK
ncbi:MAG: hypothetical protein A2521_04300 [Deltaproteobacteria bacterium RIFOXYD12_FULL_57_12]|nr:MAG: hypothetical protein A2521_04300 [Deltaproteobacteria bacterium RIFOXYD12_FULL_57_12]